jgi:hypothetical protein
MEKNERTRVLGSIAQANADPKPPVAPLSLVLGTLAALTVVVALAFLILTLPTTSIPPPVPDVSYVESTSQTYLKSEGHAKRGLMFEQLASLLATELAAGTPYSEAQILALLGPPDLMADAGAQGKTYVFLYDRFGTKDWAAWLIFKPGRRPTLGFNATSANNLSGFVPYSKK